MPTIGYRHLTLEKRCQISALLKREISQAEIAKDLNVTQSTISREIKRNRSKRGYHHNIAEKKAAQRKNNAHRKLRKMTSEVTDQIKQMICSKQWSPEQISNHLKCEQNLSISHEWIYKLIWSDKRRGGQLFKHLRRIGKKYNKRRNKLAGRGLIPNRVGIENRPTVVDEKSRVGDFEIDTVVGARHVGAIVTIVDRKTKLARLKLLKRITAEETRDAVISLLDPIKAHVQTITADNGKEFAKHVEIAAALEATVYFANPYSAWERGLNENTNGLIRQYFPKGSDFTILTDEQVQRVEYLLNTRPRKTLNYQTPLGVFTQLTGVHINYALPS